ncbi:MAG TPA: tetratricopeptide repeat protein [Deltaproteobacteria bacterium]|nr:tetratricopeptide repeat protein [Deltaproteobacteria bacterium]
MSKWIRTFTCAAVWLTVTPAFADPPAGSGQSMPDEDRVTGKAPPPLSRDPRAPGEFGLRDDLTPAEFANLPLPYEAYRGAEILKMEPEFVHGIQSGLELIYLRRYNEARDHFARLEEQFPNTGIRAVADTLVWQALMLENFDYRYDKQYWTSSKQARADLESALATPGNEAWEHLLMAAILGIESIHTMRQSQYLSALQLAFQAMDHIERSRDAAPNFVDLKLADGLYNYWRTVVTLSSKMLPDFGDHRVEGIEQMQIVEDTGLFIKPMATLSLAFTWMEESKMKEAATACARNRRLYPDNIVNNIVTGTVSIYRRDYDGALRVLDHVHEIDENNARAHYWKGLAHLRKGDIEAAKREFTTYLDNEHLEKYQRSHTNYRLGQVAAREKDFRRAADHYEASIKIDGNKSSKRALDRLKQRRRNGNIDW